MAVTYVDGALFRHGLTAEELGKAKTKIESARVESQKLRAGIRTALVNDPALGPAMTTKFLGSKAAILAASVTAGIGIKPHKRPKLDRCLALPSTLSVQCPITEPDYVRARPKGSGGFRVTHDFGLKNRTAQQLIAQVIGCYFIPRPWQYTMAGIHKAIADVKKRLKAGYPYFATFDIVDHFGSFDEKKLLNELPIPKEWVDYVVLGRHLAVEVAKRTGALPYNLSPHGLLHLARRGIPLGSVCSPIVAAYDLSKLQWNASAGVEMIDYADNFAILGSNSEGLEIAVDMLTAAVAKLPGGHFTLKPLQSGHAKSGVDFLGHQLFLKGTKVRTLISLANQESITSKLIKLELLMKDKATALARLMEMCALCKGWLRAFSECDDINEWQQYLLAIIGENANKLGVSPAHIYQNSTSLFELSTRQYDFVG